ncbi:MAG TPA: M14 family metallopeptidase, partial [Candidatus Limnocylindrales bacterium]|nr:M14 family metallopeptidase [Candidatus Limnocylindrales bacterium]
MAPNRVTRGPLWVVALLVALVFIAATPVSAAEPSGYGYFHTYAEMGDVIDDAVADHPGIAAKFSIGQSYQGRAIRAIRITANVGASNQGKPEIFINGMIHGRERASGELAIHMIEVLTNNFGQGTTLGQRVTSILQNTVVYIVPMVNPDGAEFDFQGGTFHKWRKNRQPIPGSGAIGVDLNRQFGYTWNCCPTGSSGNPSSDFYRGPEAWFAPEVRAYRNFVNDRAHRLEGILSLHSAGRQVLWPYAYTKQDVPSDMTAADHQAMVALGRGMAQRNGYKAEQGSDLYIVAGDQDDWAYGVHGIYAFTIEMAKGSAKRYYPSQSELNRDLDRNRKAILWYLEQADSNASQSLVRSPATAATAGQGSTVSSEAFAESAAAATQKFNQSVFNANAVQPQKTNCWCVVASTRAWLRHMNPSFSVKQSDLNAYMTTKDKNDWTDPSTSYYIRCTGGSPSPSFAHDGRGMAWTLWNNRPAGTDHGFQDYKTTTAKAMNWQFVRNIRATGDPVGAIVAAGQHAILVVGYKTRLDPFHENGEKNNLYGFRVWDPWYQAGFGNWSGWPAGGFSGNAYVTVQDWNQKYFKKDVNEGPYYSGAFVGVLPSANVEAPSDNPGRSYGQDAYDTANADEPTDPPEEPPPADPPNAPALAPAASVADAISLGLRTHGLLNDPALGNLPASYAVGSSVMVESLAAQMPSYLLVELMVGSSVRAVASVNVTSRGYVFGELRPTTGSWRLPSSATMSNALRANGLS